LERIADHQKRNDVFARLAVRAIFAVKHFSHSHRVHAAVPGHVGHENHQRVDAVRVALDGIGNDVVHQPVRRQRMLPRERVVDAYGRPIGVDRQFLRVRRKAKRRGVERRVGLDHFGRIKGAVVRHYVARVGRLVSKPTGGVDGAQHAHQYGQRADGLKTIRVRSQSPHGVESNRACLRGGVDFAPGIGPGNRHLESLLQSGIAHLPCQLTDAVRSYARNAGGPLGRATGHTVTQQLERRRHAGAVGQGVVALKRRVAAVGNAFGVSVKN